MWTWWVRRSSSAPVKRSEANTLVHSSKGRLLVIRSVPVERAQSLQRSSLRRKMEAESRDTLLIAGRQLLARSSCAMETILGDILTWSWFSEPHGYNFNGLLIPQAAGNICVDPVEPGDEVLSELARRGVGQIIL